MVCSGAVEGLGCNGGSSQAIGTLTMCDPRGARNPIRRMSGMGERSKAFKLISLAVILALTGAGFPLLAEEPAAGLRGVIRAHDRSPLEGARLLAAEPDSGEVYRSEPTAADGSFVLAELAPGSYDLAVEVEGGFYLVKQSLELVGGVQREVQVAVAAPAAAGSTLPADEAQAGMWNNPFIAGGLVLGFAILVGALVKNATEDELSTEF